MTIILNTLADNTPNTTAGSFVAIDGEHTESMGLMLMWNMRGTVNIEAARQAWADEGLDALGMVLPADTTPHAALKRALTVLSQRRVLVRPLGGRGSGWALVDETATEEQVTHEQALKACIDNEGALIVTPYDHSLAPLVREHYEAALAAWNVSTLSYWLGNAFVCGQLQGVALKERGGAYFIPPQSVPVIEKVQAVLHKVSDHSLYCIPMVQQRDAMRVVLDSVTREAREMSETLSDELAGGDLGKRALGKRQRDCDEMLNKLTAYDGLLGNALDAIKKRIGDLRGDAVATLLMFD